MFKTMIRMAIGLTAVAIIAESISEAIKVTTPEEKDEAKVETAKRTVVNSVKIAKNAISKDISKAKDKLTKAVVYTKAYIGARLALRKREKEKGGVANG